MPSSGGVSGALSIVAFHAESTAAGLSPSGTSTESCLRGLGARYRESERPSVNRESFSFNR